MLDQIQEFVNEYHVLRNGLIALGIIFAVTVCFRTLWAQRRLTVNQVEPYTPDTAQSAFKKRGFSDKFVKSLREILGNEKFTSLIVLGEKYYLFDQDFFLIHIPLRTLTMR